MRSAILFEAQRTGFGVVPGHLLCGLVVHDFPWRHAPLSVPAINFVSDASGMSAGVNLTLPPGLLPLACYLANLLEHPRAGYRTLHIVLAEKSFQFAFPLSLRQNVDLS